MNEIWPELIQRAIEPPKNLTETVDRLVTVLDEEHKIVIAAMSQEDLDDLHFSLGSAIRNAVGFWESRNSITASCGATDPDDVSDQVVLELWKRLNQKTRSRTWTKTFTH